MGAPRIGVVPARLPSGTLPTPGKRSACAARRLVGGDPAAAQAVWNQAGGETPAPMATETVPQRRFGGLFGVKSTDAVVADTEDSARSLSRSVGALDLTALGIGAIIGTGIFVDHRRGDRRRPGRRSSSRSSSPASPALFSALSYAELAAIDPGLRQRLHLRLRHAGRARGLDHRLGPDPRVRRLGRGGRRRLGRQYLNELLDDAVRLHAARRDRQPAGRRRRRSTCPRSFIVLAITGAADRRRARERAREHGHGRASRSRSLAFFIVARPSPAFNSDNLTPFAPERLRRRRRRRRADLLRLHRLRRRSRPSGEEAKQPERDLPIAIIGSLVDLRR